jgi:hypothetical protein
LTYIGPSSSDVPPELPPKPPALERRVNDDVEITAMVGRILKGKMREVDDPPPPVPSREEIHREAARTAWALASSDGSPGPSMPPQAHQHLNRSDIDPATAARRAEKEKEISDALSARSRGGRDCGFNGVCGLMR